MTTPQPDLHILNLSRRQLMQSGAGLALAMMLPLAPVLAQIRDTSAALAPPIKVKDDPVAFVRIDPDNTVVVICKHLESGQGTYTGLATLVAEELGCSWAQIRVEPAPSHIFTYSNGLMGGAMGTGGQTGMQSSWMVYRTTAAAARQMILAAAATRWGVDADSLTLSDGVVKHASGKQATLGELAADAGKQKVPKAVVLKDPSRYKYIGKQFPRVDSRVKVNGTAMYPQDVHLPGMLTAVVARPTRIDSKVKRFDAAATLAMPGVVEVVQVESGIAVIGKDFWSAKRGRDVLKVEWDDSAASRHSTQSLTEELLASLDTEGTEAAKRGDAGAALAKASKKISVQYIVPHLAHATMEPMNVVVQLTDHRLDLWGGPQMQMLDLPTLAFVLRMLPTHIHLHMMYVGGSFGRRAQPHTQAHIEAVRIARDMKNKGVPLKVVWTREDDLSSAHSYFRPGFVHRIEAGLDAQGNVVAWRHKMAGKSILASTLMRVMMKGGIDDMSVEGGRDQPYDIPNFLVTARSPAQAPLASWLRTSGTFHNGFAVESTIDQLAILAGADPVAFRRKMLGKSPRALAALDMAADKAGWSTPLAPGKPGEKRGRGVAVLPAHRSFGAAVIEVTIKADKSIQVDRVVCVVDCGTPVNPDNIRSQIEGATAFGLSSALMSQITFADGQVQQTNFHQYEVLRMHQMPKVEAWIVPSDAEPNGASETPMAPIAPALANAIAAATGQRLTSIPFKLA
ncbi:xanthine dehydrogenase family protein molybdopterin-binding subunit [soil metagenome]